MPIVTGALLAVGMLLAVSCKARETGGDRTDSLNRPLDLNRDTAPSNESRGNGATGAGDPFSPPDNLRDINADTAPPPVGNEPGDAGDTGTGDNGSGDSGTDPLPDPGPIELSADEELRERIAGLTMEYRWPQGMYPFGLRKPLPPHEANEEAVLWQMIYRAHAAHRRGLYEQAESFLLFALEQEKSADHYLVLFNLGACRQMMASTEAPQKLDEAVDAYRQCLSLRLPPESPGPVWTGASFRHFAAGALARIEMERGNRPLAIDYAIQSAFTWTPTDFLTGQPVSAERAADRLLEMLYAYGDDVLARESNANLYELLTTRRPAINGATAEQLLADFWISCVSGRQPGEDAPKSGTPICYSRRFLQTFLQRWLDDFSQSPRRPALQQLARESGLTD